MIISIYRKIYFCLFSIILLVILSILSCTSFSNNQGPDVLKNNEKLIGISLSNAIRLPSLFEGGLFTTYYHPAINPSLIFFGRHGIDGKSDIGVKINMIPIIFGSIAFDYKYNIINKNNFMVSFIIGLGIGGFTEWFRGEYNFITTLNSGLIIGNSNIYIGLRLDFLMRFNGSFDAHYYPVVFFGCKFGKDICIVPEVGIVALYNDDLPGGKIELGPLINVGIGLTFKFE